MAKLRVTTFVGTRPELIRMSSIVGKFDQVFEHRLILTGQNPDPLLSEIFLDELDIPTPDAFFSIGAVSLGKFLAGLFEAVEIELNENLTDAVVILGDTNSALAGIIAKRRGIPVYHLEAGNRAFDENIPEEVNRRIIDHFADFNLAYTSHAKQNLLREGLHPRSIGVIGSPLCEVIHKNYGEIERSNVLENLSLKRGEYFLVSAHRQENVDNPDRLNTLIETLNQIAIKFELPILVSTHPRTKGRLSESALSAHPLINFHQPFGFFDFCNLQKNARVVLSDSGSISEEAVILGIRAITIRDSMERHEAIEAGSIVMSGILARNVLQAIEILEKEEFAISHPEEYLISDCSNRVTNFIVSTVHQHRFWNGLRETKNDYDNKN
jgi:UDP-N-acetylglucosamine 2-epimerase (non-hydrolysing)